MIKEIGLDMLEGIVEFSWEIGSAPDNVGFPAYESIEDMRTRFARAIDHSEDKLLAWIEDDTILGALCLLVEKENKYLQSLGFYVLPENYYIYKGFHDYLRSDYTGCQMYFCFADKNITANRYMDEVSADCIESCLRLLLNREDFVQLPSKVDVVEVTLDLFDSFACFHDTRFLDMYWTGARIREKRDMWEIYVTISGGEISGSILISKHDIKQSEIYALAGDEITRSALLSTPISKVFALGKESVLFFSDSECREEQIDALKVGFLPLGTSLSYRVNL